jgi:hypothetical protein
MNHLTSTFTFGENSITYTVRYTYLWDSQVVTIYEEATEIHFFDPIPVTKTANPTKSQALELLKLALKATKIKGSSTSK